MVWEQWVVIGFLVLGSIANILMIGEQRKPGTPGMAVVQVIIVSGLIYLITRI